MGRSHWARNDFVAAVMVWRVVGSMKKVEGNASCEGKGRLIQ